MTKKVKAKAKDKEQSERFVKKAREIGADESGEIFELAFKRAISPTRPKSNVGKSKL